MRKLEYKINKHISLRMEQDITYVYIDNEKMMLCKNVAVNIPVDRLGDVDRIESVDDLENVNYKEIEEDNKKLYNIHKIEPETEFFVHCSNLQVWAENYYDTRLIHSNLAFPLLKRLYEVGDQQAKKVFKEEIVKRYIEGNHNVQEFLTTNKYLNFLNSEEIYFILGKNDRIIKKVEKKLGRKIKIVDSIELQKVGIELFKKKIIGFGNTGKESICIPEEIKAFKTLKKLNLRHFLDLRIPSWLGSLNKLELLNLSYNKIESIPENLGNLANLKELNLSNNNLKRLPESINKLVNLEDFILSKNQFEDFPLEICSLPRLFGLSLNNNLIKTVPSEIQKLIQLRELDLGDNPLSEIPDLLGLPKIQLIILPLGSVYIDETEAIKKKINIIWKKRNEG